MRTSKMLTTNWDLSHTEKNFAIYYRLGYNDVIISMRVCLLNKRPTYYGIGSKPFIWFNEESLISEFLKA